jgi:CDP-glucose 4,6-dehydratase
VLESLSGYLCLGQKLIEGRQEFAQAWNFGPDADGNRTVGEVLTRLKAAWPALEWAVTDHPQPHEANLLYLDSAKARQRLGWRPVWSLDEGLDATLEWYRAHIERRSVISENQLQAYVAAAREARIAWSGE